MIERVGIWEFNLCRDCRSRSANDAPNAATKQDPKHESNIQDAITLPVPTLPLPPGYLGNFEQESVTSENGRVESNSRQEVANKEQVEEIMKIQEGGKKTKN